MKRNKEKNIRSKNIIFSFFIILLFIIFLLISIGIILISNSFYIKILSVCLGFFILLIPIFIFTWFQIYLPKSELKNQIKNLYLIFFSSFDYEKKLEKPSHTFYDIGLSENLNELFKDKNLSKEDLILINKIINKNQSLDFYRRVRSLWSNEDYFYDFKLLSDFYLIKIFNSHINTSNILKDILVKFNLYLKEKSFKNFKTLEEQIITFFKSKQRIIKKIINKDLISTYEIYIKKRNEIINLIYVGKNNDVNLILNLDKFIESNYIKTFTLQKVLFTLSAMEISELEIDSK